MSSNNWMTQLMPLWRRVKTLDTTVLPLPWVADQQSTSGTVTLTLTKPVTWVTVTAAATVSFPTAATANTGYLIAVTNAHASAVTVNGLSIAANAGGQWVSSGAAWRRITP